MHPVCKTNSNALSLFKGDECSEQGERNGGGNGKILIKRLCIHNLWNLPTASFCYPLPLRVLPLKEGECS